MTTLLHLSDTHFGTEQLPVVEALVRFVREQAPRVAVLSGDITQRARPEQFRAAKLFLNRLGVPSTVVLPGNHDIPLLNLGARLFAPYARHRRCFGESLEPVFETRELLVLVADSTRRWRHKHGELSRAQVERVAHRLDHAAPEQLRVVVMHHPVIAIKAQDEINVLRGHQTAIRVWARAGADLILGGHIHLPYVAPLHKRFDDLPRTLWAVQAGTAVSKRVRHDTHNSVNLIRYPGLRNNRRCAIVERWDFRPSTRRFEQVTSDELHFYGLAAPEG
jgi:3',5'-cyclic AMP phosphodiesterase CpdA